MSLLTRAEELAGRLPGLLLEAEKVAHGFMKGVHGRRRVGLGESFWQFRPYQPGDARRDIDWRQTARRDAPFVREMEWEAAQTVWLWRDASASMTSNGKQDLAELLLLALGLVLLDGGERTGLLGSAMAPQTGHASISRICDLLPAQTHLSEAERPVPARSHVILFSDFYFPVEELLAFCEPLATRQVTGTLVQITDPSEQTLAYGGRIRFEDAENAAAMLDITQVDDIRQAYEQKFISHRDALREMAVRIGWNFMAFGTDMAPEAALTQLYERLTSRA